MQLGMVGLGRMGAGMSRRLAHGGVQVIGFDVSDQARAALDEPGTTVVDDLAAVVQALDPPRTVWIMLPAGPITVGTAHQIAALLDPGDLVVDGGNAYYRDSKALAADLAEQGLRYADVGVSGGVWGLREGFGLMVGGEDDVVAQLRPALEALAPTPDTGWVHCGAVGSGHFTKMVHNGIEYGLMQSYAEGLALMAKKDEYDLDLAAITEAWRYGTVIRSWLLDLLAGSLSRDAQLTDIEPVVADSGEGRWTVTEGIDLGVPLPVITSALNARFSSQGNAAYSDKLLAVLRNDFGGHAVQSHPDS
jgi:6-phosphogluconate dehydrogenase